MIGNYIIRSYTNNIGVEIKDTPITGELHRAYNAAFDKSLETEVDAVLILTNSSKNLSEIGLQNVAYKSGKKITYSDIYESSDKRISFILK